MTLEDAQKIVDITVKGFVAVGIAVASWWLTKERLDIDRTKLCADFAQQTFEIVQKTPFSDPAKAMLDYRLSRHAAICGALEPKFVELLNNGWLAPVIATRTAANTTPAGAALPDPAAASGTAATPRIEYEANLPVPQWVAISRRNDSSFSALNFDVATGRDPPQTVGNVLRARWFVNIREKNTPVVNGDNRVIGQIVGGQCVRVVEAVSGQLNEWARVSRVTCPAGGA